MASRFSADGRSTALLFMLLCLAPIIGSPVARAQFYDQPVLNIDLGMHSAPIIASAVDANANFAVTGSHDKSLKLWSLSDGNLLRTIYVPAGPGNVGKIYAVAASPNGDLIAAGGWTGSPRAYSIYLFDVQTGRMIAQIESLFNVILSLAFSPNGRYLAAGLGLDAGLRVFDRDRQWEEIIRDTEYEDSIYGLSFTGDDDRLATASDDGKVRLYTLPNFEKAVVSADGTRPTGIAFSPDGKVLAVGNDIAPTVDFFDGHSLKRLPGPDVAGLDDGNLDLVAWSRDGKTLYAMGEYRERGQVPVFAWSDAGRGGRQKLRAGNATGSALIPLIDGGLLVTSQDPFIEVLNSDGTSRWVKRPSRADFRNQWKSMSVSWDGMIVDFDYDRDGASPLRFNLLSLNVSPKPPLDGQTNRPGQVPTPPRVQLDPFEHAQSFAVNLDGDRFVIGTDWFLRALDTKGQQLWKQQVPGSVWAVNIIGNGQVVVAAYDDGTILAPHERWPGTSSFVCSRR
jgi:WD40 repeat protein